MLLTDNHLVAMSSSQAASSNALNSGSGGAGAEDDDDDHTHCAETIDPAYARFRDQTRFWVQRVGVPLIMVIGLFGNLITVVIMTRRRMRSTTNMYLAALAFVDMLYLVLTFILGLSHYPNMAERRYYFYWKLRPILMMLTDACSNTSVWLTVTFTIERFIAIKYPMKGKIWCIESRAKRLIASVFIFAIIFALPVPFEWQVVERRQSTIETINNNISSDTIILTLDNTEFGRDETYKTIYYRLTAVLFYFLPLISITLFNCFLIHSVHRSKKERNRMINKPLHSSIQQSHHHDETSCSRQEFNSRQKADCKSNSVCQLSSPKHSHKTETNLIAQNEQSSSANRFEASNVGLANNCSHRLSVCYNDKENKMAEMGAKFHDNSDNFFEQVAPTGIGDKHINFVTADNKAEHLQQKKWPNTEANDRKMKLDAPNVDASLMSLVTNQTFSTTSNAVVEAQTTITTTTTKERTKEDNVNDIGSGRSAAPAASTELTTKVEVIQLDDKKLPRSQAVRRSSRNFYTGNGPFHSNGSQSSCSIALSNNKTIGSNATATTYSQERRITIMLIAVVLLFLVCQIPPAAMLLYTSIYEAKPNTNEHAILLALGNIFNFLMAINAAGNFILYSFLSKKYRKTFVILFCNCLKSELIRRKLLCPYRTFPAKTNKTLIAKLASSEFSNKNKFKTTTNINTSCRATTINKEKMFENVEAKREDIKLHDIVVFEKISSKEKYFDSKLKSDH